MAQNLSKNLKKLDDYRKEISKALSSHVAVGLPKENVGGEVYENGTSIIDVGLKHEFGTGVPRRSFLREPLNANKKKIKSFIQEEFGDVFLGKKKTFTALTRIGAFATNISKEAFRTKGDGSWAPLAPSTVKAKGYDTILIQTGTLRNSITWKVRGL